MSPRLVPLLLIAACSGESSTPATEKAVEGSARAGSGAAAASPTVAMAAGSATPTAQPPTAPPPTPDTPGTHLDDDALPRTPPHAQPVQHVPSRPIDVTLRTTPAGARATVDGQPMGTTPTFWAGDANGKEHEFTFVYDGRAANGQRYAVARYRFVPVASGIIHVKLEPLVGEDPAAGSAGSAASQPHG
jgi:hypothetical protein|nr:hypothetical protein [Kofleriaceae bacterium]